MCHSSQQPVGRGLWVKKFPKHCESVKLLDPKGMNMLLASRNKIYHSSDFGSSWDSLFSVPINYLVSDIIYNPDSSILCGVSNYKDQALYRYDIPGKCLTKVLDDAAESHPLISTESDSVFFSIGLRVFFYKSIDFAKNWSMVGQYPLIYLSKPTPYYICSGNSCIVNGHRHFIFGFVNPSEILITDDTAKTWKIASKHKQTPDNPLPQIVAGKDSNEFFCCINNGTATIFSESILHSSDYGSTWNLVYAPSSLWSIATDKKKYHHCIVGTFSTEKFPDMKEKLPQEQSSVYESYDNGVRWHEVGKLLSKLIWNITFNENCNILYATAGDGLYVYNY